MSKRSVFILLTLLTLVSFVLVACGGDDNDKATLKTLNVRNTSKRLDEHDDAILVDVRREDEWQATGVPVGAQLITWDEVSQELDTTDLPKDAEIYLICNSGNRSQVAAQYLIDNGYKKVYSIEGGFQAWKDEGLPLAPYSP